MRDDIQQTIGDAIGAIDYVTAALSRAEHGPSRGDVANARSSLKAVSASLLALRARADAAEKRERGELTPITRGVVLELADRLGYPRCTYASVVLEGREQWHAAGMPYAADRRDIYEQLRAVGQQVQS